MSNKRAVQIIDDRVIEIDNEYTELAEAYPTYVTNRDRESVGETEGKLSGLRQEKQTLTQLKGMIGV